jgi:septal ring factor EnvC (AmiA/AmiB activator)
MEYNRIVAVTGLPHLYELLTSKTDGAIVRSLEDKSSRYVSSRIHNLSHLESIEVFTTDENVNLADVFHAMKNSGDALPDAKDNKALRTYFEKVYPTMDFERVYTSDLKKMVKWYEVLQNNDIEIKLTEQPEETEEVEKVEKVEKDKEVAAKETEKEVQEIKEVKKAKTKKTEAKAEKLETELTSEEPSAAEAPKKRAKKKKEE